MNKEEIIKAYPSICYNCGRSRRPVSDTHLNEGLVGCTLLVEEQICFNPDNIACEEMYSGWVYLKRKPFSEPTHLSGVWTNCQLMTLKTTKCKYYVDDKGTN